MSRQERVPFLSGGNTQAANSSVRKLTVGRIEAMGLTDDSGSTSSTSSIVFNSPVEFDGGFLLGNTLSQQTSSADSDLTDADAGRFILLVMDAATDRTITLAKALTTGARFSFTVQGVFGAGDLIIHIGETNTSATPRTMYGVLNQNSVVANVTVGTTITIAAANAVEGDTLHITKVSNGRVHVEGTAGAAGVFVVA